MDNTLPNMHERLVDHLDGISSKEEQMEVESLIASDPDWKNAWEDLLATRSAIRQFGLRHKVGELHHEMMKEQTSARVTGFSRQMIRPILRVAAAVILILASYWVYEIYSLSPEKIFNENYKSYDIGNLRAAGSSPDSMEYYFRQKEYTQALRLYDKATPLTNKSLFLAGSANMELRNYAKAREFFNQILSGNNGHSDTTFKDESQYYLALAYIATKNYDQALPLLKLIKADKNHTYHQAVSSKLINDIKLLKWK